MSLKFLKYIYHTYQKNKAIKGYENIYNSYIEKLDLISPQAYIYNSHISGNVTIEKEVRLESIHIDGCVKIGVNTAIEKNSRIISTINKIEIGRFCSIAPMVEVTTVNHNLNTASTYFMNGIIFDKPSTNDLFSKGSVKIGSDVWVGTQSIILPGVSIGDGAVVGANSTVTKDIPPYAIYAGNPARLIKWRFTSEIINELLRIKWWFWPLEKF